MIFSSRITRIIITLAIIITAGTISAQSISFARWKNNATGAYSVNHDDYGEAWWGDFNFVDSILVNRGLTVSFSTIAAKLDRGDSGRAANYVAKGQRFINHSMNHVCDTPVTETNLLLRYTTAYEYDSAQARIERMIPSQGRCLYWATPCGNQSEENLTWLRTHAYIGCRNDRTGQCPTDYNLPDPFNVGEPCNGAGDDAAALNSRAQQAITTGNWVSRMFHCVSDNSGLGWAPISYTAYRGHMDWCKQQVVAGQLWMAPAQTICMYALERSRWSVAVTSSNASQMQITIDNDSVINQYVDNHLFTVPLTLLADLPSGWVPAEAQVVQNEQALAHTVVDANTIRFDAAPWGGVVTVYSTPTAVDRQPLRIAPEGATRGLLIGNKAVYLLNGRYETGSAMGPGIFLLKETADVRPVMKFN